MTTPEDKKNTAPKKTTASSEKGTKPSSSTSSSSKTTPLPNDRHVLDKKQREAISAQINLLVTELKDALEEKDWQTIANKISLNQVSVNGHPEKVDGLIRQLEIQTENLYDFEVLLTKVLNSRVEPGLARYSLRVKLIWNAVDDWEDHEWDGDVHVGFTNKDGHWTTAYLGFNTLPADIIKQHKKDKEKNKKTSEKENQKEKNHKKDTEDQKTKEKKQQKSLDEKRQKEKRRQKEKNEVIKINKRLKQREKEARKSLQKKIDNEKSEKRKKLRKEYEENRKKLRRKLEEHIKQEKKSRQQTKKRPSDKEKSNVALEAMDSVALDKKTQKAANSYFSALNSFHSNAMVKSLAAPPPEYDGYYIIQMPVMVPKELAKEILKRPDLLKKLRYL